MFKKIFNKKEINEVSKVVETSKNDDYLFAFETLIILYLHSNGIDPSGNRSNPIAIDKIDREVIRIYNEITGFNELLEQVVIKEWDARKLKDNNLKTNSFTEAFIRDFYNRKISDFVPEDVRERNKKLEEAYRVIISIIEKIQALEEKDDMKIRIESDMTKRTGIRATIFQCTTRFCIVSLGCDPLGKYNIVFSIDHRLLEMISDFNANILIRRIYQCTPGEMEQFVYFHSLYEDCACIFSKLNDEAKTEPYHKIISMIKVPNS